MPNLKTDKRTPVLIIEDESAHAKSIIDKLTSAIYKCEHHRFADEEQIYKYLASTTTECTNNDC
jgi:hypothetical protein